MSKPLRILAIVNLPWDERLGAPRVWMELAEQWRAAGHTVEKFSLSDAFPGVRATRVTFALRQLIFIRKAAAFVRQHGHRFDVIDALIGTLPFSGEELGFPGLLVARSVGLYRLYDRFDQSIGQRWSQPARGKWSGRLLYQFTRRRLLRASERAVQQADVINVPNEQEAACLRDEIAVRGYVMVQPYGLTAKRRHALQSAAQTPAERLAQKRVCFIGMWGPRKGALDWPAIIARVRQEVPDARFRFLGTMVETAAIQRELGPAAASVECISDYHPDELPRLLGDCTVGAFPSYVEGFGLAVIEQLAAGLPTIAYDIAGPRDILRDGLVPCGDVAGFATALCRVLRAGSDAYRELAQHSVEIAAKFSWQEIAQATLKTYRARLQAKAHPVVFVQRFSLGSAGGGARILRALLEHAPFPWRSISTLPTKSKAWRDELHLACRPSWGAIEHSRLAALPKATAHFFARSFQRRLRQRCLALNARAIHAVPHAGLDFAVAQRVARELALPFFISLHDDLAYTMPERPNEREQAMRRAWLEASARFVISEALGREYCRRYGARDFLVVTDGLSSLSPMRERAASGDLRIYFMGLFHMPYEQNLRALLEGIALFESQSPQSLVSLTLRCEHVRPQILAGRKRVRVLPFASEAQVRQDMEEADLLYMPIPFGEEHANFARYSLSTKMVTYVGSGVPILYHGPAQSAAADLLRANRAALIVASLSPPEIAAALATDLAMRREVARNAHALAEREFMLEKQVERFDGTIMATLAEK